MSVICSLPQGLNFIFEALMRVYANDLGGIHMHKLFPLIPKNDNSTSQPFRFTENTI